MSAVGAILILIGILAILTCLKISKTVGKLVITILLIVAIISFISGGVLFL